MVLQAGNEQGLANVPERYKCVFGMDNIRVQAQVLASDIIQCPPPPKASVDQLFPSSESDPSPDRLLTSRHKISSHRTN